MHETHDGVQDMACDTFIKIAIKCRRHFTAIQPNEASTFIDEILATMSSIICDLQPQQVSNFLLFEDSIIAKISKQYRYVIHLLQFLVNHSSLHHSIQYKPCYGELFTLS